MAIQTSFVELIKKSLGASFGGVIGEFVKQKGIDYFKEVQGNEAAFGKLCTKAGIADAQFKAELGVAFQDWCSSTEFTNLMESLKTGVENLEGQKAAETALESVLRKRNLAVSVSTSEIVEFFLLELFVTLNVIDERHRESIQNLRHQEIVANQLKMKGSLEAIEANLALLANKEKLKFVPPADELEYHAQVDLAFKHMQHAKPQEAERMLIVLRNDIQSKMVSQKLLFRLSTALNVAYTQMEQFAEAKREALVAVNIERSRLSLCNFANTSMLCGDYDAALTYVEAALKESPEDPFALAVYLQVLSRTGRFSEIPTVTNNHPIIETNPGCLMVLGQCAADQGKWAEAQLYFSRARLQDPYSVQLFQLEAQAIVIPYERNPTQCNPFVGGAKADDIEMLTKAEKLASECIKELSVTDFTPDRVKAYLVRASARFFLGKITDVRNDLEAALKDDPTNDYALIKKAICVVHENQDYLAALAALEQVKPPLSDRAQMILCDCLLEVGRYEEAKVSLEFLEASDWCPSYIIAEARMKLTFMTDIQSLGDVASGLHSRYSSDGDALLGISEFYRSVGDLEKALKFVKMAESAGLNQLKNRLHPVNARIYLDMGLWRKAVERYEKYIDRTVNSPDLYDYIVALSNCGEPGTASVLARQARERNSGRGIKTITDIEAVYQEHYGQIIESRNACISLIRENQQSDETLMRLQRLNLRLGRNPDSLN